MDVDRLGPYRLLGPLGRGGMGQVFAAVDERLGLEVAVKILLDPRHAARFLQEARALHQVDHPGVVRVLAVGSSPPYLVMELLRGETLRQLLRRQGKLSPARAARLGRRLAEAMAAVHRIGIVHRDLKPENIILVAAPDEPRHPDDPDADDGDDDRLRSKIIDFGVARVPPPPAPALDTLPDTGEAGPRWLGTLTYMAPEQCRAAPVTDRADVYALGVLLYEALSGAPPFVGEDPVALAADHLRTPPPSLAAPRRLQRLLDRMLAKDPADRPSMSAVAAALTPAPPRRTFLRIALCAAASLSLSDAGGMLRLLPRWPGRRSVHERAPPAASPAPAAPSPSSTIDPPAHGNLDQGMVSVILLAQPALLRITAKDMRAARGGSGPTLVLSPPTPLPERAADFAAAYEALRAEFAALLRPVLDAHPETPICYFGSAPIPLSIALGALIGPWHRAEVLQHHHAARRWTYLPPPRPPLLRPVAYPEQVDQREGDVILRVSVSHSVDRAATLRICPAPLYECDVALEAPDEDALGSAAAVAKIADAVKAALDALAERLPRARVVHLFASVPAGLAFLIGARLSPTQHPPIQTYQYQRATGHVPALLLNSGPNRGPSRGKPMDFQPLFRRFHGAIELSYNSSAELRQMRDEVLNVLRQRLAPRRFVFFNQGSYEVGTGIKPPSGSDYDIDIGVVFPLEVKRYQPLEVKRWVRDAVHSMGTIDWMDPCIRVQRKKHHLDIAVFIEENDRRFLARGKENDHRARWQPDGLKEFLAKVDDRFPGQPEDTFQFKRVVRYLKRWKDVQSFPRDGRAAPTGCALTVAAYKWFRPRRSGAEYNDLGALETLVAEMLRQLTQNRELQFPEEPHDDVLRKMSPEQHKQFLGRLRDLGGLLAEAQQKDSTAPLRRAFGADFPER